MRQDHIRNFCIVAHIDHGKSTLADRLIELTGTLDKRLMREQVLDTMDLERERGITIKLNAVRMHYRAESGQLYELNLIDTPGHVDFTYEVSRSLAACEGAILVVDASQGVQAQTLANVYLALDHDLAVVPVINKIDLPSAEPENVRRQIEEIIGLDASHAILAAAIKEVGDTKIGDTITDTERPAAAPLPGFLPVKPMVFSGLYPAESAQYDALRDAVEKLRLNDSSFTYEPETSLALGFGFRCGFLGLLHMEIVQERLEREFQLALITTAPTVAYRVVKRSGEAVGIDNPAKPPPPPPVDHIQEPHIPAPIHPPVEVPGHR